MVSAGLVLHYFLMQVCGDESAPCVPHPVEAGLGGLGRCPTLCDPVDCSLPGSSVHGILQARILE